MRTIKTDNGKSFSISIIPCPFVSRKIPLNVIFITDPAFSEKDKKLPLSNNNDIAVVNDKYTV